MTWAAPEDFYEHIRARLVGSLTLYCGDPGVAEELAQDALIRVWDRWDSVRLMASPEAWTYRTAFNLASSWGRRRSAERRARRRLDRPEQAHVDADMATVDAIRGAVAALPPRQRTTIVCRYYIQLDVAETAELMDCAEGTVKAATSRALHNLRSSGLIDEPEPEVERT